MADFNLGKAKAELKDYIHGVMVEYYWYFKKNGVDPLNIQNEQLEKNLNELNSMDGMPVVYCKTEEDIQELTKRVDELRSVIK